MAHSLMAPPASSTSPISPKTPSKISQLSTCHPDRIEANFLHRRTLVYGLLSAGWVALPLMISENASAAQKRASPKPPVEKKDPNVSGTMAKVIASKKRKDAMKEEIAKLRERGKPVS